MRRRGARAVGDPLPAVGPAAAAALYPLAVLAMEGVALRSFVLSLTGGLAWEGRTLGRPRIRLW